MRQIVLLLMVTLMSGMASAETAEDVFDQFRLTYEKNENFFAEFEQTTFQQNYKTITQGKLYFAKPNLLRMEYFDKDNPKQLTQSIVLDGKHAWSYTPVLNQVNKSVQTQQGGGTGILPGLGASFEYLKQRYALELVEDEAAAKKNVYRLALSPKESFEFKEIIEIWVRQQDWLPIQFSYQTVGQPNGDLTMITSLRHIKVNQQLPDDIFRFAIPEGAEVISINPQQ